MSTHASVMCCYEQVQDGLAHLSVRLRNGRPSEPAVGSCSEWSAKSTIESPQPWSQWSAQPTIGPSRPSSDRSDCAHVQHRVVWMHRDNDYCGVVVVHRAWSCHREGCVRGSLCGSLSVPTGKPAHVSIETPHRASRSKCHYQDTPARYPSWLAS